MAVDAVLLESPTMRATVSGRVEVLDRVKALAFLPDGVHVTTDAVARYFGVGETVIKAVVHDHRQELVGNGYQVLTGGELGYFKQLSGIQSRARSLALFTRRTVLNVAMLLRDSETARQVRCYLLDLEQQARREAVDNPVDGVVDSRFHYPEGSVDAAVATVAERAVRSVIGTSVVPLLNALAVEVSRNGRKIDAMADRVDRLERVVLDDGEKEIARRRLRLLRAIDDGATADELDELVQP
ncbi:restriction endonuclease [Kitasatospora sp. NPDC101801]|uniref:restriction endonuclease n=1 Tax=Kitasatospora sp. NPDC101801 TaxID=3364103 RepID=UPI0037F84B4E